MKIKLFVSFLLLPLFFGYATAAENIPHQENFPSYVVERTRDDTLVLSSEDIKALRLTHKFNLQKTVPIGISLATQLLDTNQKIYCPICMNGNFAQEMVVSDCGHVTCIICLTNFQSQFENNIITALKCSHCNQENPLFMPLPQLLQCTQAPEPQNYLQLCPSEVKKIKTDIAVLKNEVRSIKLLNNTNSILFNVSIGLACYAIIMHLLKRNPSLAQATLLIIFVSLCKLLAHAGVPITQWAVIILTPIIISYVVRTLNIL